MKTLKDYKDFINEASEFNWDEYGEKRELIETKLPYLINKIRPLKEFGKRIFNDMDHDIFGGSYVGQLQKKYGLDTNLIYYTFNKINTIGSSIGPNLSGEFKSVKRNIWQKILGKPGLIVTKGTSIIDTLINIIPEFNEELLKKEKDLNIQKMVDEIWDFHPNNPKNKKYIEQQVSFDNAVNKALENGKVATKDDYESNETRYDIEKQTKVLSDIAKAMSPFKDITKNESREEWYDTEEWVDNKGVKRKSKRMTEKYFIDKAKNYRQMMVNLSNMVLKYKEEVIETLTPYMEFLDKKVYNILLERIDSLYIYINGDSSHIKGDKNQHQFSIVEMLDKYISKDSGGFVSRF